MAGHPVVSVIIPAYNRAGLIGDALDSIRAQGYPRLQAIVIDDGSTDETKAVVSRYPEVEYLFQENRGSAAARNAGVERARGQFVAFLDSDDVWMPGKLDIEMNLFERFPSAGAVISDSEHWLNDELRHPSRFAVVGLENDGAAPWVLPKDVDLWVHKSLFSTCCLIVRREVVEQIGIPPFEVSLGANEDWDFEIRMYRACDVVVYPKVLARVRRYPDNTRRNRALPGTPASEEQIRSAALRHSNILRRASALPGLTPRQNQTIWNKIAELELKIG